MIRRVLLKAHQAIGMSSESNHLRPLIYSVIGAVTGFALSRMLSSTSSAKDVNTIAECPRCKEHEANDSDSAGRNSQDEFDEDDDIEDSTVVPEGVELKMVICVRQDLNMSKGKIAAQVGHAVLACYRIARRITPEYVKAWLFRAQAKITLKVDDETTMDAIQAEARKAGIACIAIEDAGRTEVEPGTRTVLGIGPAPKADVDKITGPKGKFPLRLLA